MLIHQKIFFSSASSLFTLIKPVTQTFRALSSTKALTFDNSKSFSTNVLSPKPQQQDKEGKEGKHSNLQDDQFLDSVLSDMNYNDINEYPSDIESSYQLQQGYAPSNAPVNSIPFDELLNLLQYIALSPGSLQKLKLTTLQLATALNSYVNEINIQNAPIMVWAFAKLGFFPPNLFPKFQEVVINEYKKLPPFDIAVIIWSFAKLQVPSQKLWSVLIPHAIEKMPGMSILDLQQLVWALEKIKHSQQRTWLALEDAISKYLWTTKNEQAISLFMMCFAKMRQGSDYFWKRLEEKFESSVHFLGNQALTNSLWALARRNKQLTIKTNTLEASIIKNINSLKDIEVASISWAFLKLGKGSPNFWTVLSKRISEMLERPKQDLELVTLCTCAWVLKGSLNVKYKDWKMLEKHILDKQNQINTNHLYSILASFAQKKQGSEELWKALEKRTFMLINEFDEKSLATVIWCFATADKGHFNLWVAFLKHLKTLLPRNLSEKSLVISLWGFAKKRFDWRVGDFEPILEIIDKRFNSLKSFDIGIFMWSLGKLNHQTHLTTQIVQKVITMIHSGYQMSSIDFIQCIFAIHVLGMGNKELWTLTQQIVNDNQHEIEEEGWVLLVQTAATNPEFTDEFWELAEKTVMDNLKRYSTPSLIGFMNGFEKADRGSMELWVAFEEAIKKDVDKLNENRLAEAANVMAKRGISQNEFWTIVENSIIGKLDNMKISSLARLSDSFATSEKGSMELWTQLQDVIKKRLQEDKLINKATLLKVLCGFAQKKTGDHQFWNILEKRILHWIKRERIKEQDLLVIIKEFSKVKRGSRELWARLVEIFVGNLGLLQFNKMLRAVKSLIFVKEIDDVEKEMIFNKINARVLSAEPQDFPIYLEQLAMFGEMCKQFTEQDITSLSKKVMHQTRLIDDSVVEERMRESLNRIRELHEENKPVTLQ